uniref:Retrovirus-related Pol polyprotein from transposon TNT 1-94 n=1 Tax=Tanacetum cinerariifolium TaxID=118510 RepID=A0A699IKW5_TANCI|nr:retrovirus-related Pol polyprotein from transposon TNT 1-94 [Tanacetum cinerariifolium]
MMRALMVHHGCDAAFETLAVDMEAGEKAALMKNAYSTLILCLRDRVLLKVTREITAMMNKLILDLANIDIEIEDENQALMLLILLPSSYENFVETLLYERESLTMEDALATLNSMELKKRTEGTKEGIGDGLYVRGGQIIKVKLILVEVRGLIPGVELVNSSASYVIQESSKERLSIEEVKNLISLGILEKEGYTVKMQMGRIKVIKGCRFMMIEIKKKNCLHTLEAKVMTFGVQKHGDSKQVGFKQLGSKKVGFKQLGFIQFGFKQLVPGVETRVCGVQVDDRVWLEAKMQGAQENHEAEGLQVGANIMVTIVPGQVVEGNVAEKKKVKESVKTNLGKLLKYNA